MILGIELGLTACKAKNALSTIISPPPVNFEFQLHYWWYEAGEVSELTLLFANSFYLSVLLEGWNDDELAACGLSWAAVRGGTQGCHIPSLPGDPGTLALGSSSRAADPFTQEFLSRVRSTWCSAEA